MKYKQKDLEQLNKKKEKIIDFKNKQEEIRTMKGQLESILTTLGVNNISEVDSKSKLAEIDIAIPIPMAITAIIPAITALFN